MGLGKPTRVREPTPEKSSHRRAQLAPVHIQHPRKKLAMKKIITTALVAATAALALSACNVDDSTNAGVTSGHHKTGSKAKPAAAKSSKAASTYTVAQQNAIESAHSYLDLSGFSRAGLIQQLSSKAGEGYKLADAVFAVNHIKVDWNKEAVESAKSYLQLSSFSRAGLIQQLSSKAGDGYTVAQATYAANHVGL
jgi:Host cell surface-exposed lipoprotein